MVRQLIEELEQMRQEGDEKDRQIVELQKQNDQKKRELDAAVREKSSMETEVRLRIAGLQETIHQQQIDQNHTAQEMRSQIDDLQLQKARLQVQLSERRRQSDQSVQKRDQTADEIESLQNEVDGLKENVARLERLLTDAETAMTEMRQRIRQSEEVLGIASQDINLTDKKLGSGSYGGKNEAANIAQ